MTDRLSKLFECSYNDDSQQHYHHVNYRNPKKIMDQKTIMIYEKWSAESIKRLKEEIELLTEYRSALAERYSMLETTPAISIIRLRRQRNYSDNKVYYYLEEIKRFLEIPNIRENTTYTDEVVNSTTYSGKERRDAIKAFEEYKKSHPGIVSELDIEKGRWER